ncbi:MAG: hypothetical protein EWV81_18345 [Microcystis aeruginosa Ma_SC_T_19800800_S464]|jgi:hypothetical protein|uniref:Transposase n=1 Tax=Microcystis aeruginosa Ma_SC_T_19800800_S464 TaxID=2486257 RepID=A0A552DJD6_MICAE|nr:MAG: hypothetical protein EWV81_18345 [Microcystis aeruginosa Ma_SC_T_19800800_S464]
MRLSLTGKQISRLVGVAPINHDSGQRIVNFVFLTELVAANTHPTSCVAGLIYQCEISRYQGRNSQQIGKFRATS